MRESIPIYRMNERKIPSLKLRIFAAIGLFFLSPFIAEYLLGNIPVTMLWLLPVLALLYGGGCILIRETAVRLKLKWDSILILCLAYGILEEGFYTQSLFDPDYLGFRLLDYGYIKNLGIGSWWTVYVLGLHIIWSTAVPVAFIEFLSPKTRNYPFLGKSGFSITAVLFSLVCIWPILWRKKDAFLASTWQLIFSFIVVIILIVIALLIGRTKKLRNPVNKKIPGIFITGAISFLLSSSWMALTFLIKTIPAIINIAGMMLLFATGCLLFRNWSARSGWSGKHSLGLIGGLLLTYIWHGFVQFPSIGNLTRLTDTIGNIVFSCFAVFLFYIAWRKTSRNIS
jgi:hypothetical protein